MKHVVHKPLQTNCFPCEQFLSQWMSFWRGRTHFFLVSRQIIVYLRVLMLAQSSRSPGRARGHPALIRVTDIQAEHYHQADSCSLVWMGLLSPPLSCLMSLDVTRCHSPGEHYQCRHHSPSECSVTGSCLQTQDPCSLSGARTLPQNIWSIKPSWSGDSNRGWISL